MTFFKNNPYNFSVQTFKLVRTWQNVFWMKTSISVIELAKGKILNLLVTLKIPLRPVRKLTAILNCLFKVCSGWEEFSSCVDINTRKNKCSSILRLVLKNTLSKCLLGSSNWTGGKITQNSLKHSDFFCSFCISRFLNNTSNEKPAFVTVSACPISFNVSKIFISVQISIILEEMIISFLHLQFH